VFVLFGAHRIDVTKRSSKHVFVEKEQGGERLILGLCRDLAGDREVGQKRLSLFLVCHGRA